MPRVYRKKEERLQLTLCNYLRIRYPKIKFLCDVASGIPLSIGQASLASKMRSSRAMPDVHIMHPKNGYHGLYIELKKDGTKLYLKDGRTPVSDQHIREQLQMRDDLNALGYKAVIAIGFDHARKVVDEYLCP